MTEETTQIPAGLNRIKLLETVALMSPTVSLPWQQTLSDDTEPNALQVQRQLVNYLASLDDEYIRFIVFAAFERKTDPNGWDSALQLIEDKGRLPREWAEALYWGCRKVDYDKAVAIRESAEGKQHH